MRPHDRAISKIAASFSSCGKVWWKGGLLLRLTVTSSNLSFFWAEAEATILNLFLKGMVWSTSDLILSSCCTVLQFVAAGTNPLLSPAAAAAALIARLAFICLIPQALQRDCTMNCQEIETILSGSIFSQNIFWFDLFFLTFGPWGPLLHRGVFVVLQLEQTLMISQGELLLLAWSWRDWLLRCLCRWIWSVVPSIFLISRIFEDIHLGDPCACSLPMCWLQLALAWSSAGWLIDPVCKITQDCYTFLFSFTWSQNLICTPPHLLLWLMMVFSMNFSLILRRIKPNHAWEWWSIIGYTMVLIFLHGDDHEER